jgi:hypothetical protein
MLTPPSPKTAVERRVVLAPSTNTLVSAADAAKVGGASAEQPEHGKVPATSPAGVAGTEEVGETSKRRFANYRETGE